MLVTRVVYRIHANVFPAEATHLGRTACGVMTIVNIQPARAISGAARLPGDKSISHRYAMLAALAGGTTRLQNFSTADDCARTLACLQALGVRIQKQDGAVD